MSFKLVGEVRGMLKNVDVAQKVWLIFVSMIFLYFLFIAPKIDVIRKKRYDHAVRIIGLWGCVLAFILRENLFSSVWYVVYYVISIVGIMWPFLPATRRC